MPDGTDSSRYPFKGFYFRMMLYKLRLLELIYFYLYPNPTNGPVTIHTENIFPKRM